MTDDNEARARAAAMACANEACRNMDGELDLDAMARHMLAYAAQQPVAAAERTGWRCFHCDAVSTEERCARLHFGRDEDDFPACQIKAGAEQGLLGALRDAERAAADAQCAIADETTEAARAYYAQSTRHNQALRNAEELGYERGLADGRALPPAPTEQPVAGSEQGQHGLGPHATVLEDDGDGGFMPVAVLVGSNAYIKQAGSLIVVTRDVAKRLAGILVPTEPVAAADVVAEREACAKVADVWLSADYDESANIIAAAIATDIRARSTRDTAANASGDGA